MKPLHSVCGSGRQQRGGLRRHGAVRSQRRVRLRQVHHRRRLCQVHCHAHTVPSERRRGTFPLSPGSTSTTTPFPRGRGDCVCVCVRVCASKAADAARSFGYRVTRRSHKADTHTHAHKADTNRTQVRTRIEHVLRANANMEHVSNRYRTQMEVQSHSKPKASFPTIWSQCHRLSKR